MTDTPKDNRTILKELRAAVREYHAALDARQHGGVAAGRLVDRVQETLQMPWRPNSHASGRSTPKPKPEPKS